MTSNYTPITAKEAAWNALAEVHRLAVMPSGMIQCPRCGGLEVEKSRLEKSATPEFVCESEACKTARPKKATRRFSVTTGTILEGKKSLQRFLHAAEYILQHKYKQVSVRKLGRAIGTTSGSTIPKYRDIIYHSMIPPISSNVAMQLIGAPLPIMQQSSIYYIFLAVEVTPTPGISRSYNSLTVRIAYYAPTRNSDGFLSTFFNATKAQQFFNLHAVKFTGFKKNSYGHMPKKNSLPWWDLIRKHEKEVQQLRHTLENKDYKRTPIGQLLCEYMFYRNFELSQPGKSVALRDLYACLVEPRPYDDLKRKLAITPGHGL